jgi:hypothetical protein
VIISDWIKANTRGVLLIQIRDRPSGGWEMPYVSNNIADHASKPFLLLQHNWFKMMEYFQNDMLSYFTSSSGIPLWKVSFQYKTDIANKAALNFHLTKREEKNIMNAVKGDDNRRCFEQTLRIMKGDATDSVRVRSN